MVMLCGLGFLTATRLFELTFLPPMTSVAAVSMSKDMHEGARGKQQKGKNSEQVRAMLGDKKEPRN